MDPLARELKDVLDRIRQAGQKVFIYDDDGMKYSPVVARTEAEAKKKALGGRDEEEWDGDHQALIEVDGEPL
jgi:hypothetical protein